MDVGEIFVRVKVGGTGSKSCPSAGFGLALLYSGYARGGNFSCVLSVIQRRGGFRALTLFIYLSFIY